MRKPPDTRLSLVKYIIRMAFTTFDEHKLFTALVSLVFLMAARSFPEPAGLLKHLFDSPLFRIAFQLFVAFWAVGDAPYAIVAVVLFNLSNNVLRTQNERNSKPLF
jgi:hypothetical protein